MDTSLNLVWMRRDLRLHDHAALAAALEQPGLIQPVFVFDSEILTRFSSLHDRRLSFIATQLSLLDKELRRRGGGLLVLRGAAREVMPKLCRAVAAARLVLARDVEPLARARDQAVTDAVQNKTAVTQLWDHLLLSPEAVCKEGGAAFRVFTPYYGHWRKQLDAFALHAYSVSDTGRYANVLAMQKMASVEGLAVLDASSPAAMLEAVGYRLTDTGEWKPQDAAARLERFASRLVTYPVAREYMGEAGTSKLSPYLRFGLLSVRECARRLGGSPGGQKWLSELAWRDFYAMILYHFPEVVEQEFQPRFRGLAWNDNQEYFARWQEGRTGYPVVDAAMRELLKTGWMHNRARMIVASFLTKDLLIDWRRGEEHFAQHLMDYDLASNNGGWQWAASTGTDAQPWFRIFNPVLQGKKFDPGGTYIRRYVPELSEVPDKHIHEPWRIPGGVAGYPARIVEHHEMREKALAMFKAAR